MSRTYRRKGGNETNRSNNALKWALRDWRPEKINNFSVYYINHFWYEIDPKSDEGRRRTARYHSDAGTWGRKEPGPKWFRNLTTERPLRRFNRRELQKFIANPDYEPMCLEMGYLEYWT